MTYKALPFRQIRPGKLLFILCWICTTCLSTAVSQAATYYRWVDNEGVPHYTSTPPQGIAFEKVSMGSGEAPISATSAPETTEDQSQPAEQPATAQASFDKERCEQAQQRLQTLQSGRRLRMKTDDGSFYYLDEQEIQREVTETQQVIDESC